MTASYIAIHKLDESEVHMVGDAVCVRWNVRHKRKTIKGANGLNYTADVSEREGQPYIDFVTIVERGDEVWMDEDSPADGGLSLEQAEDIHAQLGLAIEYLRKITQEHNP